FANVMQGLVGMANVTQLRTKLLAERFELFRYLKKTLLVGVDVEADFLSTKGAAGLKGLVGGEGFDAEQKGGTGSFQMQGNFNVLITSNARLKVRLQGDVGAWKRRITIVRYEAPPPAKRVPDFGAHLVRTEGSGILNWALVGAQKLLTEMPDDGGGFRPDGAAARSCGFAAGRKRQLAALPAGACPGGRLRGCDEQRVGGGIRGVLPGAAVAGAADHGGAAAARGIDAGDFWREQVPRHRARGQGAARFPGSEVQGREGCALAGGNFNSQL